MAWLMGFFSVSVQNLTDAAFAAIAMPPSAYSRFHWALTTRMK
jgi:hypothetical protein